LKHRFKAEIDRAVARTSAHEPLERLRAIARAYLHWAMRNPAHFEVHSTQRLFDFDQAMTLQADDNAIRTVTRQTVQDAADAGMLRSNDVALVQLAGRAMVYGFARMKIDGHFARWGIPEADAERIGDALVDQFIAGIAKG